MLAQFPRLNDLDFLFSVPVTSNYEKGKDIQFKQEL